MDVIEEGPRGALTPWLDACHRPLAVLFWDIVGSCALLSEMPLESFRDLMRSSQDAATDAIHAHGGFVAQYLGDGILAYFGYPRSLEDDTERAVRAALAIRAAMASRQTVPPIQCRVAIASGPVIINLASGAMTARELSAFGEAPNLAARLLAITDAGSIVVADNVRSSLGGLFAFQPVGNLALKGFPHVHQAWRVLHARDVESRFVARYRGSQLRACIGRQEQIDAILSAVAKRNTADGHNAVVVTGEAGIGKSHLLHTVADQLRSQGALVLEGDFARNELEAPFTVLVDAIRRGLDIVPGSDAAAAEVIRLFQGFGIEDHDDARLFIKLMENAWIETDFRPHESARTGARVRDLLVDILCRIGQGRTVVLMLEDLHWADHAVHDLLLQMLLSKSNSNPFLLLSDRTETLSQRGATKRLLHLALTPLQPPDIKRMILARSEDFALAEEAVARIVTVSEGNPLFAEELLAARRENGGTADTSTGVPESIARITLSRVDHLTPETQHLLGSAAILGVRFTPDLLAFASKLPPDRVVARLQEAGGLVDPDGAGSSNYRFRHSLIHAAIYDSLLPSRREAVHRRIAAHLEADCDGQPQTISEVLAHHFGKANEAEKAIEYLVLSGTKRLTLYALKDADAYFDAALDLAVQVGPQKIALVLARRMRVLELTCAFDDIIRVTEQYLPVITGLGPNADACAVLNQYSHALLHGHRHGPAVAFARRGLAMAEQLGSPIAAAQAKMVLMKALNVHDDPGHLANAERLGGEILNVAEAECDVYLACAACFALAMHHLQDGQLGHARTNAMHLMQLGRQHADPRTEAFGQWLNGWIAVQDLRYDEAIEYSNQSLAAAVTAADRLVGMGLKGLLLSLSGQPREGLRMLRETHAAASSRGDMNLVAALDIPLGVSMILNGSFRTGFAQLRTTIARRKRDGYAALASYGHLVMGEIYVGLATRNRKAAPSAASKVRLWDKLVMAPHVLLPRRYARRHLRIAAQAQRWGATSAGRIRIQIAQATLAISRRPTPATERLMELARDTALAAGLPGLAKAADATLCRFSIPPGKRPGWGRYH